MVTPTYDIQEEEVSELGRRLSAAVGEAMSNLGWKKSGQH